MITDKEVLAKHDPEVRIRTSIELKIVNCLLSDAKAARFDINIPEYEGEETPDVKAALFNLDEAHVCFRKGGKKCGWVYLVFGNGCDLISDYTVNLEDFLKNVNELSDKLSNGDF